MRSAQVWRCVICAAAVAVCALPYYGCSTSRKQAGASGGHGPGASAGGSQAETAFVTRDLRRFPPEFQSLSIRRAKQPTAAGDTVLLVQFAERERLPAVLTIQPHDQPVLLRDDGKEPDERARDGTYSALVHFDARELEARNRRLEALRRNDRPLVTPIFRGRQKVGQRPVELIDLKRFGDFDVVRFPFPGGIPAAVDGERSLVVRSPSVVNDPTRSIDPCNPPGVGATLPKWSFGYLMTGLANEPVSGINARAFTRRWMKRFEVDQPINDFPVPKRPTMTTRVIDPWLARSQARGLPADQLDLAIAPFRLLAIVNRIDLAENLVYGGGSAGEARFVFGAVDPDHNCQPLPFTVIFEYGIRRNGCAGLKDWAQQWANLSTLPLGSAAYDSALEAITEQFAAANSDPGKPNGSALNQLRTNEIIDGPWQLREFRIFSTDSDAGHLRHVTVKQSPHFTMDPPANQALLTSATLKSYVETDAMLIVGPPAQGHQVPLEFPTGSAFLGGASDEPGTGFFWNQGGPLIAVPGKTSEFSGEARHQFSLGTCNACHTGETGGTPFTHISPTASGPGGAALSGFMTGIDVQDPAHVNPPPPATPLTPPLAADSRRFNELERRAAKLDELANMTCFHLLLQDPRNFPLHMTH